MTGTLFSCSINELIEKDERFSVIPEEILNKIGDIDEQHDGEVEVYKYNDGCPTF
jgi:hypothetical protein